MFVKWNDKGFTLIELAIVMVIVGLLAGFGASMIVPLSVRAKRMETTEAVNAATEAVIGYAAAHNGRLPTVGEFPGIIGKYKDAWRKPLEYVVDSRFCDDNPATGDLCTRKTAFITVRQCVDSVCTSPVTVSNVAFVVLSGGENYNNQTSGSRAVSASVTLSFFEAGVDNVDGYNTDMNRPEVYDDITRWVTLNGLKTAIGCKGPPLEILNDILPPGKAGTAYSAAVYTGGGVPFSTAAGKYKWCLETTSGSPPSGLVFRNHSNTTNIGFTTNASALAEGSATWVQSDSIQISGTPTTPGSYLLTAWARDNSNPGNDVACGGTCPDNCASRSFVVTINP